MRALLVRLAGKLVRDAIQESYRHGLQWGYRDGLADAHDIVMSDARAELSHDGAVALIKVAAAIGRKGAG